MKHRQNFLLALLACASLAGSSIFAANNFYVGSAGGDWMTAANWSTAVLPSTANPPFILSNSSVVLSNTDLSGTAIASLSIGSYYYSTSLYGGTGSLTIDNSTVTVGTFQMATSRVAGYAPTGVSSLALVNGSVLTMSSTSALGYYTVTSDQVLNDRQRAEMTIDATSKLAYAYILNVGRSTIGTLSLLGSDTASVAAQANIERLTLGALGTTGVDAGSGHIYMGTHSLMTVTRTMSMGVSGGAYSNSFTMNGASLYVGSAAFTDGMSLQLFDNSTLSATSSTISVYRNLSSSGLIALNTSSLSIGANATLSAATLNLNQSSVSITGTMASTNSSTIQLTDSTLSVGGAFTATSSATATAGTAVVLSGSHLVANGFSLGLNTDAVATGALNSLTMTNSALSVTGDATLTYAGLSMENSTITASGRFVSRAGGTWNVISNSTISAASMEFSFTANSATISNTVITLSTTSAIAPLGTNGYSAAFYLKDGSSIYIGTYGVLGAGNVYLGANSTSASLTAVGGVIRTNSLTSTNSAVNLSNNTYTLAGNLSATSSAIALTNSTILISTSSSLSGSSLGMNSSSISMAGALSATNGVAISLVNSTLSIGTSLTSGIVATSAGGTSINATGSTISAGTLVFSGVSSASSSFRHAVNLTNSSLQVSTLASFGYAPLTMYNSILTVGTNVFLQSDSANTFQNSTVSSGGFEGNFNSNTISMIGSVMTLSSTVSVTPVLATRTYTTRMYAKDNSSIAVGDNGYLGVGYLYLGSSGVGSLSMTGGSTSISNAIYVGAASGGAGYLSVSGGTATIAKTLSIGVSGAGTVSVSGTGVLYAPVLIMSGNATLSGNVYIQGAQATPITAAGQATFDTMRLGSGAVLTGGTVHVAAAASISLALSGTPATFQSVKIQSLAFDGASTINVDFTNIAITEATEIVVLLADTVSGLEYNPPITTIGLDSAWQALYESRTIGGQTALVAMISAIPEPALSALLAGGLGLWVAVRRRHR